VFVQLIVILGCCFLLFFFNIHLMCLLKHCLMFCLNILHFLKYFVVYAFYFFFKLFVQKFLHPQYFYWIRLNYWFWNCRRFTNSFGCFIAIVPHYRRNNFRIFFYITVIACSTSIAYSWFTSFLKRSFIVFFHANSNIWTLTSSLF